MNPVLYMTSRELKKKAKQATSQESQPQEKADQPEEMCQDEDEAGEDNGADEVADPPLKQKVIHICIKTMFHMFHWSGY